MDVACRAVYIFLSYRLFLLTDALRHVVIPDKASGPTLIRNALTAAAVGGLLYISGAAILRWTPLAHHSWPEGLARDTGTHFHP